MASRQNNWWCEKCQLMLINLVLLVGVGNMLWSFVQTLWWSVKVLTLQAD